MANSKFVGLITCPLCGNEQATVHEQQTGSKKGRRYYRCYSEINGSTMVCGTIQCLGPAGQEYIAGNIRPIGQAEPEPAPIDKPEPEPAHQPEPEPAPIDDPEPEPEPIEQPTEQPHRTGFGRALATLLSEDDDDE